LFCKNGKEKDHSGDLSVRVDRNKKWLRYRPHFGIESGEYTVLSRNTEREGGYSNVVSKLTIIVGTR